MKRKLLLMPMVLVAYLLSAQVDYVPIEQVKQIAFQNATSLWGEVYADEPIPLYNLQDELIAYTFNFSIGKHFPDKNVLIEKCDLPRDSDSKNDRWLIGDYGNMLVSAKRDLAPIVNYTQSISDEYAYGAEVRRLASQKLKTDALTLQRIYLMNDIAKWYCFSDGIRKVFVKVFPPVEVYTEQEFNSVVLQKYNAPRLWTLSEDIDNMWDDLLTGKVLNSKADHLIPNEEYVPFYDWSYGCTPTAFAMALAYWDNRGIISANDYGNLVKHHFQRYDHGQYETDKNVPDLQKALAIAMSTDTMTGTTGDCCWLSGFIAETSARGYSFSGQDKYGTSAQYLSWTKTEINNGRPIHWGTPGHSNTAVGYTDNNYVICHRTWQPVHNNVIYTECDLVGTIVPGGSYGAAVNIVSPYGDPRYSDYATLPNQGEHLYAGNAFEITWNYDYHANTYARILYSTNGGLNWNTIVNNIPNNGLYDWRIPSGLPNSTHGRVKIEIWHPQNGLQAADGSWGNFDFHTGGSLPNLSEDVTVNTTTVPDYFQFTNTPNYWSVVGIRSNNSGEDWDIQLHGTTNFNDVIASSSLGGSAVDFVVIDGSHTTSTSRGIKAKRFSGTGTARIEFEGGTDIITPGNALSASWPAGDVVEIYDVYLTPGLYGFILDVTSGNANLDFALYGSSGSPYYAGRSAYKAISSSGGAGGDEYFTYEVTTADWYGLCIWANDANPANYTLRVERPGTWTGLVSTNWNNSSNWSGNILPSTDIDVIIPSGTPYQPNINTANASCKSLTINSGATLTVGGYTLNVSNDINISGTLAMNNLSGKIFAYGDVFWKSGSTANFTANSLFWVYGNWEFQAGSNANLANGVVAFTGTTEKFIRNYSQNSSFNNVSSYKSSGAEIGISNYSNQILKINGDIYVHPNAAFCIYSNYDVILKGNLNSNSIFKCNIGKVVLNGTSQFLRMNTGDYFNNLTFNQSGTVTINDANTNILEVKKDVVIKSGVFNMQDRIMRVGGDWTNEKGSTAFNAGTGRVIFNGASHQYVNSSENFNILEVDKGAALRVANVAHTVTCNQYDWTSGGIDVLAGTFTALDLADDGIYGNYYVNPGGTINLHQDASQFIDLNGKFNFHNGGTINVYGGWGDSYWPWYGDAEINMNGGVLDFKDKGIYIFNSSLHTFTHNITGGTIRTSKGLGCNRTDFTPAGGTFEFYGSTDATLEMASGSHLYDVKINKSSKEGDENYTGEPVYDQRSGELLSDGTRANNLFLSSDINILGDLTISAGSLTLYGKKLNIKQDCYVSGTLNMTNPSDILTVGQSHTDWLEFESGSTANITAGTINIYGWIIPRSGSSFNASTGNTVVIKGDSGGGLSNYEPSATYGNVILQKNSGEKCYIDLFATEPIVINGSFTISPGNEFYMNHKNLTVNGNFTDVSTSKIYMRTYSKKALAGSYSTGEEPIHSSTKGGTLTINSDYFINGLLDIADGNALLTQGFGINSTGVLKINGGSFINNQPEIDDWTYIRGSLQLADGLFELTYNHPFFDLYSTSIISGGIIRTGSSFSAQHPDVFKPTGGAVEIMGGFYGGNIYCYHDNYFHDLIINRPEVNSSFIDGNPPVINNDFIVNHGEIRIFSDMIKVNGNIIVNNGGRLTVEEGNSIAMAASKSVTVNNGGLIQFNGTAGTQSKITRQSSGYYALNIESGGKIAAEHSIFEYMNIDGVNLKPGAIVDPARSFTNCIFRNGQSGGRMLTINNNQTFSVNYAMFPNNSWGGNFNVYKSENSGVVTFGGYSGGFSGGSYEYDPNNRIHWGGEVAGNVTLQGVDVVSGQDICFDATNTLTIAGGGNTFVVQDGGNVNLIAGHNIRMLEGTSVHSGAYLHAYISNVYCTLPPAMLAAEEDADAYIETVSEK
ncbi:MAG: C39 family peptidase, partial [Bacteroidales bacterium]